MSSGSRTGFRSFSFPGLEFRVPVGIRTHQPDLGHVLLGSAVADGLAINRREDRPPHGLSKKRRIATIRSLKIGSAVELFSTRSSPLIAPFTSLTSTGPPAASGASA